MKNKSLILITVGIALLLAAWLAWPIAQANAQCGATAGSCKTCHEIQGQYSVGNIGDWHMQHSFGDYCDFCHGGDKLAEDKVAAHAGMVHPLSDVNASCAVCHTEDCDGRALKYANLLGVPVGKGDETTSSTRPKPLLPGALQPAGPNLSPASPGRPTQLPTTQPTTNRAANWGNLVALLVVITLALAGGSYVLWNEGILKRPQAGGVVAYIQQEQWSPYVAGAVLGIVAILIVIANTIFRNPEMLLSASAPFQSMFGGLARLAAPDWLAKNVYYRSVMKPGVTWGVVLLLGMALGGALSALSSGAWKLRWMPEKQWAGAYGPSRVKRWIMVFVGTIVLEIGAGIAGGCTSGLAIWGGLQLAPAAFLFMGGMFASGILMALIVYRGKY